MAVVEPRYHGGDGSVGPYQIPLEYHILVSQVFFSVYFYIVYYLIL